MDGGRGQKRKHSEAGQSCVSKEDTDLPNTDTQAEEEVFVTGYDGKQYLAYKVEGSSRKKFCKECYYYYAVSGWSAHLRSKYHTGNEVARKNGGYDEQQRGRKAAKEAEIREKKYVTRARAQISITGDCCVQRSPAKQRKLSGQLDETNSQLDETVTQQELKSEGVSVDGASWLAAKPRDDDNVSDTASMDSFDHSDDIEEHIEQTLNKTNIHLLQDRDGGALPADLVKGPLAPTESVTNQVDEAKQSNFDSGQPPDLESHRKLCAVRDIPEEELVHQQDLTPEEISFIRLSEILDKHRAPLNLYNDVVRWARECISRHEISPDGDDEMRTRRTMVTWLEKRFPSPDAQATTVQLEMPMALASSPQTTTVNFWNFSDQLQDLLKDLTIFGSSKNVVHCESDPFGVFSKQAFSKQHATQRVGQHTGEEATVGDDGLLGDCHLDEIDEILEGSWYEETVDKYKEEIDFDPELDIIIPIIIALDKTTVSGNKRYGLEPIVFTLALIARHMRNNPKSWRHLGLLPDIEENAKAMKKLAPTLKDQESNLPGRNLRNYHACTDVILQSLVEYQKRVHTKRDQYDPTHDLYVFIGNKMARRRVLAPICFCIVDGLCADSLCCRMSHDGTHNDRRLSKFYPNSVKAQILAERERKKEETRMNREAKKGKKASTAKRQSKSTGNAAPAATAKPAEHDKPDASTGESGALEEPGEGGHDLPEFDDDEDEGERNDPAEGILLNQTAQDALLELSKIVNDLSKPAHLRAKAMVGMELHGRISRGCTCRPDEAGIIYDEAKEMDKLCKPISQAKMSERVAKALSYTSLDRGWRLERQQLIGQLKGLSSVPRKETEEHRADRVQKVDALQEQLGNIEDQMRVLDQSLVQTQHMSQHLVINAYHRLDYGANEGGIYEACPPDVMHAFVEGVLKYVVDVFFYGIVGQTAAVDIDRVVNCYSQHAPSQTGRKQFPRTSFKGGISKTTNMAAHEYQGIAVVLSLSMHDPEIQGFLERSFKTARKAGLFQYHQLFMKPLRRKKGGKGAPDETVSPFLVFSTIFADIVSFLRWTREGPFYKGEEQPTRLRNGINRFLWWIQKLFPRKKGAMWELQKIHDLTKLWFASKRYGSLMNFDNGPAESNHKILAKIHGRRAQEHGDDLYRKGTSHRIMEMASLNKASAQCDEQLRRQVHRRGSTITDTPRVIDLSKMPHCAILVHGTEKEPQVWVVRVGTTFKSFTLYKDPTGVPEEVCRPETVAAISEEIIRRMKSRTKFTAEELAKNNEIPKTIGGLPAKQNEKNFLGFCFLYTECKVPEKSGDSHVLFRAHPNFHQLGPWHDWCWMIWPMPSGPNTAKTAKHNRYNVDRVSPTEEDGKYRIYTSPARIMSFLRFNDDKWGRQRMFGTTQDRCPRQGQATEASIMKWIHWVTRRDPLSRLDVVDAEVLIHSAKECYETERPLGYEYKMETLQQKAEGGFTTHTPLLRFHTINELSNPLFCFEYGGCLKSSYQTIPHVVALNDWEGGFHGRFLDKYKLGNGLAIPKAEKRVRWNPKQLGQQL